MCFGVNICRLYSRYALCLLLQMLFVAALDIKTPDVPTVSSINSLLSQYGKASHVCANFYVGRGGSQLFALPRLSHGQRPALELVLALRRTLRLSGMEHPFCASITLLHSYSMEQSFLRS
jgi:hypothetical protein